MADKLKCMDRVSLQATEKRMNETHSFDRQISYHPPSVAFMTTVNHYTSSSMQEQGEFSFLVLTEGLYVERIFP